MATALADPQTAQVLPEAGHERPRLERRHDLITMLLASWMIVGLFVDGWAHGNILEQLEGFFTPWHAVFYSGFAATASWMAYIVYRSRPKGRRLDRSAVPAGYGWGVIGVIAFGVGGAGDMVWHTIFGIEVDTEALLSPTHLLLFAGGLLILTSPLRASWHSDSPRRQSFGGFLPVLLSITLTTAVVAFFFMYLSPFTEWFPTARFSAWSSRVHGDMAEFGQALGVATYLWTTVILVGPLLLALKRWDLPFGTATMLFTTPAFGLSAMEAFDGAEMVLAAVVGGLAADLMIRTLRPSPERAGAYRLVAAAVPAVMWTANFVVIEAFWGLGWVVEVWAGTIVLTSLAAFGVAYLVTAPSARS